jgi:hypothetical protein
MRRSPGQPSVNAVSAVSPVRRPRRGRGGSAPRVRVGLRDGAENLPSAGLVSTLPIRTSRCRSPSSQLRMKVESKVTTIASASTLTGASAADVIGRVSAILKV